MLRKVTPFFAIILAVGVFYLFAYPAFLYWLFEGNAPFEVPGWLEEFFRETSYPAFLFAQDFAPYGGYIQWLDDVF